MKAKFKRITAVLSMIAMLGTSLFTGIDTASAAATTVNVTYEGSASYAHGGYTSYSSKFKIGGKRAYCIERGKTAPSGNVSMTTSAVGNAELLKLLYYGPEGVKPWSGFAGKSSDYAIVVTSKALSHVYSGTDISIAEDFYNYVKSAPAVPTSAAFTIKQGTSDANGKTYTATVSGNTQTSPTFTYAATSSANTTVFTVPASLTAYVTHSGTKTSYAAGKTATLYSGDTFYFTASGLNTTKTVSFTGSKAISGTYYKPTNTSLQTLILGSAVSAKTASLSITFEDVKGSMSLTKTDSATGGQLSGAVYKVYYYASGYPTLTVTTNTTLTNGKYTNSVSCSKGTLVAGFTTNTSGVGIASVQSGLTGDLANITTSNNGTKLAGLPKGYYSIVEVTAPSGYNISTTVQKGVINANNTSITIAATDKAAGNNTLSLKKVSDNTDMTDGNNAYSLEGAVYSIYAYVGSSSGIGSVMGQVGPHNASFTNPAMSSSYQHLTDDGNVDISWLTGTLGLTYVGQFAIGEDGAGRVTALNGSISWLAAAYSNWGKDKTKTEITGLPDSSGSTTIYYYFAVETKLPENDSYEWDTQVHYLYQSGEITAEEPALNDPISITINKTDDEGNVIDTDKTELSLEGTVFRVSYYDGYYSTVPELRNVTATREWYLEIRYNSIEKVYDAQLDAAHLSDSYVSDELYYGADGIAVIPLGTVTIEEVSAAEGYIKDSGTVTDNNGVSYSDGIFIGQVRYNGGRDASAWETALYGMNFDNTTDIISYTNELSLNITNSIQRGDVSFSKLRYDDGTPMSDVEFEISLLGIDEEGNEVVVETHTVKTDANGNYNSANDDSLIFYGTGDESKWDPGTVDTTRGKLICGTYEITEIKCDANKGYQLSEPVRIEITEEAQAVDAGTFVNVPNPTIKTKEWDSDTKTHLSVADGDVTVVDTVSYSYLAGNARYSVKGILMEIKADGSVTPLLDDDGNIITAHTLFITDAAETPNTAAGTVDVTYHFSGKSLAGNTFVIYEYLFTEPDDAENSTVADLTLTDGMPGTAGVLTDNDGETICHADPADTEQTGYFPKIETTAKDSTTGTHEGQADETTSITDTVSYTGLYPGAEYTVHGTLMNKTTGEKLLDADGNEITAEKTFTPDSSDGKIELTFAFDGSLLAGETVVVFESVFYKDIEVAVHADLNDEGQSVSYPKIGTAAKDTETGTQISKYDSSVTITDTVTYENLTVGNSYTVKGTLMDKVTGKAVTGTEGNTVTAEVSFIAEEAAGSIELAFTFDAISGNICDENGIHDVVVFETLYDTKGNILDTEEDLENPDQTITLRVPVKIAKTDEDGNALAGAGLEITDTNGNVLISFETDGTEKELYLDAGEYLLREVKAPKGYALAEDITFTVTAEGTITINGEETGSLTVTMIDTELAMLPSVGGMGTAGIVIVGTFLFAGGLVLIMYVIGFGVSISEFLSERKKEREKAKLIRQANEVLEGKQYFEKEKQR